MIIVWLSIALAVVALIYLAISGLLTYKAMKPAQRSMADTAADLQRKMDGITKETDHLMQYAENMKQDVQMKKQTVQDVILDAKSGVEEVKSLRRFATMTPNPKKLEGAGR